jgi:hypothetical protein
MKELISRTWHALFLRPSAYAGIKERSRPALTGLLLIAIIGVVIALAGLVGTVLEWASTPNLKDMQRVILDGLRDMPFYEMMQESPEAVEQFENFYEIGWQVFPLLFGAPNIGSAAAQIVLQPILFIVGWFYYGVLAHLSAKLLGGEGRFSETMGCTALAFAPQLLNLVTLLPFVATGGVVGTWALLCRYVGLKVCHKLSWQRALGAALLPIAVTVLLVALFGCLAGFIASFVMQGGMS